MFIPCPSEPWAGKQVVMDCFVLFAARGAVRHWRALNPMEVLEERRVPGAQLYEHPELPSRQARGAFEERPPGQGGVYGTQRPSAPRPVPL